MTNDNSMRGQVAIVTGGGGGIGSAICRRLAVAGAQIIAIDLQQEMAQALIDSLPGEKHMVSGASITDSAALKTLAGQIAGRYGSVDLLVNNAGVCPVAPFLETPVEVRPLREDGFGKRRLFVCRHYRRSQPEPCQ